MAAVVDKEKCTGCGDCVTACPSSAVAVQEEKANVTADDCIDCGACVDACQNGSMKMSD
jgi:NAD-dependent dihydropyrimidine dehydrogenase PreA subunit